MKTIHDLIAKNAIRIICKRTNSNPAMADLGDNARHWHITLVNGKSGNRLRSLKFSQGSALTAEPTAADVLDCLASDASSVENARDFENWCYEFGYETDSRRAEKIYKTIKAQTVKLKELMGADYKALLFDIDRL